MRRPISKRLLDLSVALVLSVLLTPLLITVSCLILAKMGRPIFFVQERPGICARPFKLYKFRTMVFQQGPNCSDEERITLLGSVLRKYSIDELPQLFNVIKGDMSLVGPRPLLQEYDSLYTAVQRNRFLVDPGITGLAQISGRNELSWEQKLKLDVEYVKTRSFIGDVMILIKTIAAVITARGFKLSGEPKKFGAK